MACEGAELKGYLKKKAKGKTISKHMRNGGINSFVFHPSPRMVGNHLIASFFYFSFFHYLLNPCNYFCRFPMYLNQKFNMLNCLLRNLFLVKIMWKKTIFKFLHRKSNSLLLKLIYLKNIFTLLVKIDVDCRLSPSLTFRHFPLGFIKWSIPVEHWCL